MVDGADEGIEPFISHDSGDCANDEPAGQAELCTELVSVDVASEESIVDSVRDDCDAASLDTLLDELLS